MSKKSLKCEYCKTLIKETDIKCPSCGADCSKIIENYREEQEKEHQEDLEKSRKENEKITKSIFKTFIAFAAIPLIIFLIVIVAMAFLTHNIFSRDEHEFDFGIIENATEEKQQSITVGYKEKAETKNYSIIVDDYEFFEYKSDKFPETYNTKEGYQKIAFHVKIENKTSKSITTDFVLDYSMKADDYQVKEAEYKTGMFTYPSPGREEYPTIQHTEIGENDSLQGYVNFTIPKNAKELKLKIGDYVTIKMNNPAYEG